MQCLLFIIRKTYGFNKKKDEIALSQFVKATGVSKSHICRALSQLEDKKIIVAKKGNKTTTTYSFNKNYKGWKSLPKKVTLPKKVINVAKKGNNPLPKKGHTIDNTTIDTITIDKKKKRKRPFVSEKPPTEQAVYLYLLGYSNEHKLGHNPQRIKRIAMAWYNHYSSDDNNWTYMAGGTKRTKMIDWKSKCRDWILRENK